MDKIIIDGLNIPPTLRVGEGPIYAFAAGSSIEILWDSDERTSGKVMITGTIQLRRPQPQS